MTSNEDRAAKEERVRELAHSRGFTIQKGVNPILYDSLAAKEVNDEQTTTYWLIDADGNTVPIGDINGYQYGVDLEDIEEAFERADRGEGPVHYV